MSTETRDRGAYAVQVVKQLEDAKAWLDQAIAAVRSDDVASAYASVRSAVNMLREADLVLGDERWERRIEARRAA